MALSDLDQAFISFYQGAPGSNNTNPWMTQAQAQQLLSQYPQFFSGMQQAQFDPNLDYTNLSPDNSTPTDLYSLTLDPNTSYLASVAGSQGGSALSSNGTINAPATLGIDPGQVYAGATYIPGYGYVGSSSTNQNPLTNPALATYLNSVQSASSNMANQYSSQEAAANQKGVELGLGTLAAVTGAGLFNGSLAGANAATDVASSSGDFTGLSALSPNLPATSELSQSLVTAFPSGMTAAQSAGLDALINAGYTPDMLSTMLASGGADSFGATLADASSGLGLSLPNLPNVPGLGNVLNSLTGGSSGGSSASGSTSGGGSSLLSLAGPLAALNYASNQTPVNTNYLKALASESAPGSSQMQAAMAPGLGLENLYQSTPGINPLAGTDFGNMAAANTSSDMARYNTDANTLATNNALQTQAGIQGTIGTLQAQSQAIKDALYGRAFNSIGQAINPPTVNIGNLGGTGTTGTSANSVGTSLANLIGSNLGTIGNGLSSAYNYIFG